MSKKGLYSPLVEADKDKSVDRHDSEKEGDSTNDSQLQRNRSKPKNGITTQASKPAFPRHPIPLLAQTEGADAFERLLTPTCTPST